VFNWDRLRLEARNCWESTDIIDVAPTVIFFGYLVVYYPVIAVHYKLELHFLTTPFWSNLQITVPNVSDISSEWNVWLPIVEGVGQIDFRCCRVGY